MTTIRKMFESHPHPAGRNGDEACAEVAQACTICADACLEEADVVP